MLNDEYTTYIHKPHESHNRRKAKREVRRDVVTSVSQAEIEKELSSLGANYKILDYDDLIKQLKKWDVSPQETWDLVYKMKLGLDTKTVWKLQRFNHFARLRLNSFVEVSKKKEKDHYVSTLNWQDYLLEIKKHLFSIFFVNINGSSK